MEPTITCPTCDEVLEKDLEQGIFQCSEEHQYTVIGLALTTNIAALRSLWMAIRALEQDGASLHHMAQHYGDGFGMSATDRRAEADAAYEAAQTLRGHARRAQQRLDALPMSPSAMGVSGGGEPDVPGTGGPAALGAGGASDGMGGAGATDGRAGPGASDGPGGPGGSTG
jgi:hypothetical protein